MILRLTIACALVVATAAAAAAEGPPPPAEPAGPPIVVVEHPGMPVEPPAPDAHWHEGFYLQLALGFGGMVDDFGGPFGWIDATASGGSGALQLLVGGSLGPGILLGGGVVVEQVVEPSVKVEGVPVEDDVGVGTFVLVGPFIDWYPSADGGFHVQGMAGGARLQIEDSSGERQDHQPLGGGVSLGAGYDWWIGDEWSLGVLGRISGGTLGDEGVTHRVGAVSVLATVTYN